VRRPKDVLLRLLLVHAAMMASVIGYGVVVYATTRETAVSPPAIDRGVFLAIAGGVAAAAAIGAFVLRARRLPRAGAPIAVDRLQATMISSWALDELVAVAGLVPAFLYGDAATYAPFGAAALLLLVIHAPRPRALAELIR
jgi:hypothetical protein